MFGNRSGIMLEKETKPKIITINTETKMVSGFLTLNFEITYYLLLNY